MSFLKTDGLVFEDDEEIDDEELEEFEDSEENHDFEDDDSEIEDSEDESLEEDEEQQLKLQQRIQEKKDANRLKKIIKTAPYRFYPFITNSEKKLINRLKKKSQYKLEILRFEQIMIQRKQAFWAKVKSVVTPALPFIGYIALGILIIILVVVIIGTLMPWLFPNDEGNNKGAASVFGMKGDKFYGGRVVYRDDVLSQNGLIEQYVDIVKDTVNTLKGKVYTSIDVSGESYDIKVEIDITTDDAGLKLPAEEFNYEELVLTDFATDYAKLYQIVGEIAKICYKVDNNADAPADLTETLNGIKYFGFNGDMIGESIDEITDNVMEVVYNGLTQSGVVSLQEKSTEVGTAEYLPATNVTLENINTQIKNEIENTINVETNKVRAEKLFIKDIILDGDDKYMEGIEKKNYVALIYLPKQNVEFDYVSYLITIDKDAEFSMVLSNNGSEISLSKGEGEYWGMDEDSQELTYMFSSADNLNQTANVADIVNGADLNKFTNGSSLYNIISESVNYNTMLEETTAENGDVVLTYKKGNVFVLFDTNEEFYLSEEIKY